MFKSEHMWRGLVVRTPTHGLLPIVIINYRSYANRISAEPDSGSAPALNNNGARHLVPFLKCCIALTAAFSPEIAKVRIPCQEPRAVSSAVRNARKKGLQLANGICSAGT